MNGAHDMGGMHGFGPVVAERNEPVFHAEWEKRVFALTLGFAGAVVARPKCRFGMKSLVVLRLRLLSRQSFGPQAF